jgi:hypothetical protein
MDTVEQLRQPVYCTRPKKNLPGGLELRYDGTLLQLPDRGRRPETPQSQPWYRPKGPRFHGPSLMKDESAE